MAEQTLFQQVLDQVNRADPYPLYAELRRTPVAREPDGRFVVSTYDEILALLHDPRVSSDVTKSPRAAEAPGAALGPEAVPFIRKDPPDHDKFRRMTMRHFGPPDTPGRVFAMQPVMTSLVGDLIDAMDGKSQIDVVDDFAYPFPVGMICDLLGVPKEDEPKFHDWSESLIAVLDSDPNSSAQQRQAVIETATQARMDLGLYMLGLADRRKQDPGDDLLSGLVTDDGPDGRMTELQLAATAILLLVAGHETTVNLITNGMLTLLRHPRELERLRRQPELAVTMVEELLRYEPPVQMIPNRTALGDIDIAGTTIPAGSPVVLLLASGNRDPRRFGDPDRFVPDRTDNQHLGLGSGVHSCFGAPMARLEVQLSLAELSRRLVNPRLVDDPPPYRHNSTLRGPRHLLVDIDGIAAR